MLEPTSKRLKEIAANYEKSLSVEDDDMYTFIDNFAHQYEFTRCEKLELYDVHEQSPEDVLADFFLDIMGYRLNHFECYMRKAYKKYHAAMDEAVLVSENESEKASDETTARYNEIWRVKRESQRLADKGLSDAVMSYSSKGYR